jgi:hypothetical protein
VLKGKWINLLFENDELGCKNHSFKAKLSGSRPVLCFTAIDFGENGFQLIIALYFLFV